MAEQLRVATGDKESKYSVLISQIKSLLEGEPNIIANLANVSSAIQMTFGFLWVGFYVVDHNELVLGPFQGPIACTRIAYGKGVCGTAWEQRKTIVVRNVNEFPGHIACSSESISEIVVPIFGPNNSVFGVLDIDSTREGEFDEVDEKSLNHLAQVLTQQLQAYAH